MSDETWHETRAVVNEACGHCGRRHPGRNCDQLPVVEGNFMAQSIGMSDETWHETHRESFREFLVRQIETCAKRSVEDDRKRSRDYHANMRLVLSGLLQEFDRRPDARLAALEASIEELKEIAAATARREALANRWIVLVSQGIWARCYGTFASYDAAIAWAKENQFDDPDNRGIYPINPVKARRDDPAPKGQP